MIKQNLVTNNTYTLKDPDHDEIKDGYQLRWVGKNYAKLQENLLPETVIVPDSNHNSQEPNKDSQNLFLTGDNLEVLKHLEHAYTGKVDMIYIDPPYNTGSDGFVYNDDFRFTDEQLRDTLGLTDGEVKRIKNIYGKSSHSAWLTFMYPRLKIAKKLLKDSGVIFVSIDDNEQANLKLLMDEVFNEGNFLNSVIWRYTSGGIPESGKFSSKHDTILFYCKSLDTHHFNMLTEKSYSKTIPEPHTESGISLGVKRDEICEYCGNSPGEKYREVIMRDVWSDINSLFRNHNEKKLLEGMGVVFDTQKPTKLIERFLLAGSSTDSLVLDFFAGSGTTAHAVMKLNKTDGGNRRYIMCTLDEKIKEGSESEKAGYKTIDEIARERIKRASIQIGDTSGFRHYRFAKPNITTLDKIEKLVPSPIAPEDMIAPFGEKELTGKGSASGIPTILTTWLVDDGYDFTTTPTPLELAGYTAYYAEGIARLYLIEKDGWTSGSCKALLNMLGKNEIAVNMIVVYPYSFNFVDLTELKNNIKANLDGKPEVYERY